MDPIEGSHDPKFSPTTLSILRAGGVVAVLAGLVNAIGDFALRGGPSTVAGSALTLESLADVPHASIRLGSLLGSLAMPLWILGLGPVFVGLRRAGPWLASVCVLLFGYGVCAGAAYHGAYVAYGSGLALHADHPETEGVAEHLSHLLGYHDTLLSIMTPPWIAASVLFVVLVATGRSSFPRWMAVTSPILVPISVSLAATLPAPFGGVVRPALGSLIWSAFFALALRFTWDGPESRESI